MQNAQPFLTSNNHSMLGDYCYCNKHGSIFKLLFIMLFLLQSTLQIPTNNVASKVWIHSIIKLWLLLPPDGEVTFLTSQTHWQVSPGNGTNILDSLVCALRSCQAAEDSHFGVKPAEASHLEDATWNAPDFHTHRSHISSWSIKVTYAWAVKWNNCLPQWRFYLHALQQIVKCASYKTGCWSQLQAEPAFSEAALENSIWQIQHWIQYEIHK